jgi:mannobiose 2-epimerase
MEKFELLIFKESVQSELYKNILPFWLKHSIDEEFGGFFGRISNDLKIDKNAAKGLILNSRILWTFSALYRFTAESDYLQIAHRAFFYLENFFWDKNELGFYWLLDYSGKVLENKKKIYGQAFCIYALSEYFQACNSSCAKKKALHTFQLIEKYAFDPNNLGYFETCNKDWSIAEDARLSEKDLNEVKSMNNHLHILEAYTNLFRIWKTDLLAIRLKELLKLFKTKIINLETSHFYHFFDENWQPKSFNYTFGHDIEGSWLLCEAADVLENEEINQQIQNLAVQITETVLHEGIDKNGGLFYEGENFQIVDPNKEWWPQAEAVVGFLNVYQITQQTKFLLAAYNCWLFITDAIVDKKYGEWYWRVFKNGQPDGGEPKVSEWKGPYHNVRACLEVLRRLDKID